MPRGEIEFDRVVFFTDAVYGIAMTVIAIEIGVPLLRERSSGDELWTALGEQVPEVVSFLISFTVLGYFWIAHHHFFRLLAAVDMPLVRLNLAYLAFVAILPFPTEMLGLHDHHSVAVAVYAAALAVIAMLEVLMFRTAWRRHLFQYEMPPAVYRWAIQGSCIPVVFLLLSIPLAFVHPWLGIATWFLSPLSGVLLNRSKPEGADEAFP